MNCRARRALWLLTIVSLLIVATTGCTRSKPRPKRTAPPDLVTETPTPGAVTPTVLSTKSARRGTEPEGAAPYPPPATQWPTPFASYTWAPTPTPSPILVLTPIPTFTPIPLLPTLAPTVTPMPIPTVAATAVVTGMITYTVTRGDTLLSISGRYTTSVSAIANQNNLANTNLIYPGQVLTIPVGSGPSDEPLSNTIVHVVKQGDTLYKLARKYRASPSAIKAENPGLGDPDALTVGTVLTITMGTGPVIPEILTHTVRRGDSLSGIARRYGVTMQALLQANAIPNPTRLRVGQVLVIPR